MTPNSSEDLVNLALGILDNKIDIESIRFGPDLVLNIKIDDPGWKDASLIDYKIANLVIKIQNDFIGIYNSFAEEKISQKNLCNYPNLIIHVRIEEGCVEFFVNLMNFLKEASSNMSGKQKIAALGIVFGIVVAGYLGQNLINYIDYIKTVEVEKINAENKKQAIETIGQAFYSVVQNREMQTYILSKLEEEGTVRFGKDEILSKKEFSKRIKEEKVENKETTVYIDDSYFIKKYDYEAQEVLLRKEACPPFWASTRLLNDDAKNQFITISNQAMDAGSAPQTILMVTATIIQGKVKDAAVIGLNQKRSSSVSLDEIIAAKPSSPKRPQKQISFLGAMKDLDPDSTK